MCKYHETMLAVPSISRPRNGTETGCHLTCVSHMLCHVGTVARRMGRVVPPLHVSDITPSSTFIHLRPCLLLHTPYLRTLCKLHRSSLTIEAVAAVFDLRLVSRLTFRASLRIANMENGLPQGLTVQDMRPLMGDPPRKTMSMGTPSSYFHHSDTSRATSLPTSARPISENTIWLRTISENA